MPGLINQQVQRLDDALADLRSKPHPGEREDWKRAVMMADLLHHYAGQTLDGIVQQARDNGTPWSAIGEALGTTKQAAQQRFGR